LFFYLIALSNFSIGYFDTFAYDSALFPFSLDVAFVVLVFHLSHSTHCLPSPAISCYPPSALTLCSLPETFTVATTLETSTDRSKGRMERGLHIQNNFPSSISSTWIESGRERRTSLPPILATVDYNSSFSTDISFAFRYFRANIFWDCNFGRDTQFLFFFYDING